ncbi:MAG: antibiotic biosynthesis monooxygenase [Acidobacteria bacterium]|nr:antibiotic biosynthesis monooxygenase [Acidobacteriota bacterium]
MDAPIAKLPPPPYYAVIFTSLRTDGDSGYDAMGDRMFTLAQQQDGFLGFESVRDGLGITISYWRDLESIRAWRAHAEHLEAQRLGREQWYSAYSLRVAKVEYSHDWPARQI